MEINVKTSTQITYSVEINPEDSCLKVRECVLKTILKDSNSRLENGESIAKTAYGYKMIYQGRLFPSSDENFLAKFSLSNNSEITLHVLLGGCTGLRLIENKNVLNECSALRP